MTATNDTPRRYIVGPVWDFLLLGGASLFLIPLGFVSFTAEQLLILGLFSYVISDVLNHPHFAASYIMFYRSFKEKFAPPYTRFFQFRCFLAGVLMPLLMIVYFTYAIYVNNLTLLGYAANAMGFLVGWHYTKQGYGILILRSVFERRFFSAVEKHIFLVNGFIFWLLTWALANRYISQTEMWGVQYFTFALPAWFIGSLYLLSVAGAAAVLGVCVNRVLRGKGAVTTWGGIGIYLISVYIWLLGFMFSPALLLFIPAFHSLQYLTVVYRFEQNRAAHTIADEKRRFQYLLLFASGAVLLGILGFWFVPGFLDGVQPRTYDGLSQISGPAVFLFSFWVFINIHHYFLDNVLWKRDNQEIKEHLFQ